MNISRFSEGLELDDETGLEVLGLFYKTSQSDLRRIESAVGENQPDLLMEAAHSIKGAARNLGFTDIAEIAKDLETIGRSGTVERAETGLAFMGERLERIGTALRDNNTDDIGV
jgi:histidine phosphotransfer protein HptB